MEVKQIWAMTNEIAKEDLGLTTIVAEDLSNIVDLGKEIFNASAVDKYVKALVNRIGKVVFVNRTYTSVVPSVYMDAWEFGSVVEKIQCELPVATENESWELEDGASYDPNIFYQPKVSAKFFNSKTTFEIDLSFTELQVKQSFASAVELNAFISMLQNAVEKAMTIRGDALIMRTINNMTAETLYAEVPSGTYTGRTGAKAINLLKLYNDATGSTLTTAKCLSTPEFIRFATYTMAIAKDRLSRMSTLFNIGGKERFTPSDVLHVVLLSDFARASDVFLQSDTYHKELVALPNYEVVPYWQGSGTGYAFSDITKIDVKTSSGHDVTATGILGVMFDRDALGVSNLERRVTTHYNAKAEFYNNFYKYDAGYFNDLNENFVVFYVA